MYHTHPSTAAVVSLRHITALSPFGTPPLKLPQRMYHIHGLFTTTAFKCRFELLGVSVTAANSWEKAGTRASRKILRMFSERHASSAARGPIPVAESTLLGVNAFPDGKIFEGRGGVSVAFLSSCFASADLSEHIALARSI